MIMGGNISHLKCTISDLITNELLVYCNMFYMRVEDRISKEINGSQVITKELWLVGERKPKFSEQILKLRNFYSDKCNGPVLSLDGRASNHQLPLQTPRHQIATRINEKGRDGGVVIVVSIPISIRIGNQI